MNSEIQHISLDKIIQLHEVSFNTDDIILVEDISRIPNFLPDAPSKINDIAIIVCSSGKAQCNIDGKLTTLNSTELLVLTPSVIISDAITSPDFKCSIICFSKRMESEFIFYGKDIWDKLIYLKEDPIIHISDDDMRLMKCYYELLQEKLKQPKDRPFFDKTMSMLIGTAIHELFAELQSKLQNNKNNDGKHGDVIFNRFMHLLSTQEAKHRSVAYYADCLAITPKYLSTICNKRSGKTALQWINEFVISNIIQRLTFTDLSIKEIAYELDFPNLSFFGKFVKRHLGMSPSEFRKTRIKL